MSELMSNIQSTAIGVAKATPSVDVSAFNGRGGNIPDGQGSFIDDIVIIGGLKVTDVTVTMKDFVHTWVGDLIVRLHHLETGTVVDLFRQPGQPHFSSTGYSSDLNGDYSFSDRNTCEFEVAAGQSTVIPSGNYAPTGSLKAFHGLPATGTWRLTIYDCFAGDSGSLGSWELKLEWK